MTRLEEYREKYANARLERDDGVLRVTLHSDGKPLVFDLDVHRQWASLWNDIARDGETRLVVITGTGDAFIPARPMRGGRDRAAEYTPIGFHPLLRDGLAHVRDLLAIPVPVIAAVNGPARVHAEVALLNDIVLATPDTVFQDQPHFPEQIVPGDGLHVLMPELMGRIRASYYLYLGQVLPVEDAQAIGMVNEIVERDRLLPRAYEIAAQLLRQPDHNLRYLRMLLTHDLRRRMHDLLAFGLGVEGLATLSNDWTSWEPPAV